MTKIEMKPSILLIHPFLSYPLESGGHQALFKGIEAIQNDFDITITFEGYDTQKTRENISKFSAIFPNVSVRPLLHEMKEDIASKLEDHSFLRRNYHKFLYAIQGKSVHKRTARFRNSDYWVWTVTPSSEDWIPHIYYLSREKHFDIIQIEMPWMLKDVFSVPNDSKLVFVHHEIGFVRRQLEIADLGETPYNIARKAFADLNEVSQLNRYNAVITLSPVDSDKLKDSGVEVPIYSSFAVVEGNNDILVSEGECKRLTFVGSGDHTPNVVGIKWFLDNCWSLLLQKDSNYSLDIIGKWDRKTIAEITKKYPSVHFCGFVDDLGAAIRDSIMIVPITIGSGIRIKILEASNSCVPFVSTTVGVEGLPFTNEENCFITDDPDSFVNDIVLLNDSSLRNKFIASSKSLVSNLYSMSKLRENRLKIYSEILGL